MNPLIVVLALVCGGCAVLSRRFAWAVKLNMLSGAALVLALLAAGASGQTLILTALALCAVTLLCGRDAG